MKIVNGIRVPENTDEVNLEVDLERMAEDVGDVAADAGATAGAAAATQVALAPVDTQMATVAQDTSSEFYAVQTATLGSLIDAEDIPGQVASEVAPGGTARPALDETFLDRAVQGHLFSTRNAAPVYGNQIMAVNMTSRLRFIPRAQSGDLRFIFAHWITGSTGDALPSASVTFRAAIEAANGYIIPLTFGGKYEATIEAGYILSDPIASETTVGTGFFVRTFVTAASATTPRATAYAIGSNGEGREAGDHTAVAAVSADVIDAFNTYVWGPTAMLTTPIPGTGYRALGIAGDSIAYGQGDSPVGDGVGFLVQAADRDGFPYLMAARAGETVAAVIDINYRFRGPLLSCASHVIANHGRNDITAGTSLALNKTNLIKFWRRTRRRGPKVYQTTITPRTTSTDGWTTTTNQAIAVAGEETVRVDLNSWLRDGAPIDAATGLVAQAVGASGAGVVRAGEPGHHLAGVIEVTDAVETARDSGIWKAGHTADGLHPSGTGHAAMAAVVDLTALLA